MICHAISEGCWSWKLGDTPGPELSRTLLQMYRALKASPPVGVLDVVPAYTELAVYFDPGQVDPYQIRAEVEQRMQQAEGAGEVPESTHHEIPVVYNGEDLTRVAEHTGHPVSEVIRLHAGSTYTVAMIGFMPNFPYCFGLPASLVTPRLPSPRSRVPAGSVAIAGEQTGVYPQKSPGGWNLIGRTRPELLVPLSPGDTLRFCSVEELP